MVIDEEWIWHVATGRRVVWHWGDPFAMAEHIQSEFDFTALDALKLGDHAPAQYAEPLRVAIHSSPETATPEQVRKYDAFMRRRVNKVC